MHNIVRSERVPATLTLFFLVAMGYQLSHKFWVVCFNPCSSDNRDNLVYIQNTPMEIPLIACQLGYKMCYADSLAPPYCGHLLSFIVILAIYHSKSSD